MTITSFSKIALAAAASLAMISAANAYTQEQEAMCTSDAFRVCSSEIPNVDAVTACMIRNRSQLSAGCRAVMDATPDTSAGYQPVSSRKASKPMNLVPQKPRRPGA
jgi:hypothetical protein